MNFPGQTRFQLPKVSGRERGRFDRSIYVPMYQRIVIYTRLFRERWSNNCILSSLWDGTCTGDAACNPTLGCAFGTDAILFAVGGACRGR